ncbi:MAG: C40 family peptidase [Bacteroidia bacterium]|nr:C40 family peptidase [Bacteroidia bacterium]
MILPPDFFKIHYKGTIYPGVSFGNILEGANCQVFAYEVLKLNGISIPPLRSSELWEDSAYTTRVNEPKPLDLVLLHKEPKAYGAHVGLYWGEGRVLHLSKANRFPKIERLDDMLKLDKYKFLIGFKRIIRIS